MEDLVATANSASYRVAESHGLDPESFSVGQWDGTASPDTANDPVDRPDMPVDRPVRGRLNSYLELLGETADRVRQLSRLLGVPLDPHVTSMFLSPRVRALAETAGLARNRTPEHMIERSLGIVGDLEELMMAEGAELTLRLGPRDMVPVYLLDGDERSEVDARSDGGAGTDADDSKTRELR
jgi:hypothetical protein